MEKDNINGVFRTGKHEWMLIYVLPDGSELRERFKYPPGLQQVKDLVIAAVNEYSDKVILNGFEWKGESVYLSKTNQLNFAAVERSQSVEYPLDVKTNEDSDGVAVYMTFKTKEEFVEFSQAASKFIIDTQHAGWKVKDSIDWGKMMEEDERWE